MTSFLMSPKNPNSLIVLLGVLCIPNILWKFVSLSNALQKISFSFSNAWHVSQCPNMLPNANLTTWYPSYNPQCPLSCPNVPHPPLLFFKHGWKVHQTKKNLFKPNFYYGSPILGCCEGWHVILGHLAQYGYWKP